MVKGDDAIRRKKNKANRKKMHQKESAKSKVSARVAAVIAAKKRRQSGKRRMCQGMCFSLPTPEDPYNERHSKMDTKTMETKKVVSSQASGRVSAKGNTPSAKKVSGGNHGKLKSQEQKMMEDMELDNNTVKREKAMISSIKKCGSAHSQLEKAFDNSGCPSKFLMLCLNSIQNVVRNGDIFPEEDSQPLFVDRWGFEFWKIYSVGKDILETSGARSTSEQIAWLASTAADTIARKEKEGLSVTSPFLLFLVPSQEKATKVRSVCKPLKALGIHTVSLHPGASLDHQIHGLKSCEPEFLVSTPERLLELISLKAIDISGISVLVVDGLGSLLRGGYLAAIKSIRQSISGNPHTVVFNDCSNNASTPFLKNLFHGSIVRLSLNHSLTSQSACVFQYVDVCALQEEKLTKGVEILNQACGDLFASQPCKMLLVVAKDSLNQFVTAIKLKGYSVSTNRFCSDSEVQNSKKKPAVSIFDMEHVKTADIGEFEFVILSDFVHSIDNYVHILTRMARCTVSGTLHSILSGEDSTVAGPLVGVLEECGQEVPEALRNLCRSESCNS